jgi:hypothetical protein
MRPRKNAQLEDVIAKLGKPGEEVDSSQAIAALESLTRIRLLRMNRIQEPFIRAKNKFGRTPKRRFLECGEKVGKTRINIAEAIAHAMGFRPWLERPESQGRFSDPDYEISIRVPNQGLVACMTMAQSVTGKVEPELEALIPPHCAPEWKRDTTGALKSVRLKFDYEGKPCGSTIHIRSYNQLPETFLGIDYDWYSWDEPPPEAILKAAERGKVTSNAPSWFAMTPLSEAYIYDRFSVKAFNAGGSDPEIAVFRGSMWDNCQDYCRKCDCYIPQNDPAKMKDPHGLRPVNRCPKCGLEMGFVPRAGIEEYLKMFVDPEELEAHIEGKWAHLSGLVYKELDRQTHLYQDFEIPRDWMKVEAVDPHDARPTRWLFAAVSPEEVVINGNPANRVYFYDYLLANGNVHEIVKQVRVKRASHNYVHPKIVVLDARYGARTQKTLEVTTSWEEELAKAGIRHIVLSHSDPGDIAIGHKRVKEYLRPHYSRLQNRNFPAMVFAENACRGDRGPIQDLFNYQWKQGTDKPEEAYKDFADCVRYVALEQPVYRAPEREYDEEVIAFLREHQERHRECSENPMTHGLRVT